jgi:primase-polymerase (primpol)-like protein
MTKPALPRWLQAQVDSTRAPQKAPPPDGALKVQSQQIPLELRHHDAWAVWEYENERSRWSKPPYIPNTVPPERAEPSDSATWRSFDEVYGAYQNPTSISHLDAARSSWDGVSFALDLRWGIVGVDLDHVSQHKRDAAWIIDQLDSYTELSPSSDGYRIFLRGTLPEGRRRRDWVEMYTQRRFLSVTGHHLDRTPTMLRPSRSLYTVWQRYVQQGS